MKFADLEVIKEKNKVVIGAVVAALVLGVIAVPFLLRKKGIVSPLGQEGEEGKQGKEGEFLLWDDQAGFTFEYPQNLYIDPHSEDMENYAHLEITSSEAPEGRILILVNDATTKTIDQWVKESEKAVGANVIDTNLAGEPAKKLLFEEPKKVLTAAIDPYEGLFLLELTPGEGDYWQKVYDQIIDSFAFKPLTEEEKEILEEIEGGETTGGGGGNVIYMEEEVIE